MLKRNLKQEEETRKKFNKLKPYYDQVWDRKSHTLHVGMFRSLNNSLLTAYRHATHCLISYLHKTHPFNKDSIVLDVGCGNGNTLISLCKKHQNKGIGLDISDAQIREAKASLKQTNLKRKQQGLPRLRCRFICGSASNLNDFFRTDAHFTHVISQDSLFLVADKRSCFRNLFRLLCPGGAIGISDFLENQKKKFFSSTKEKRFIYRFVNWKTGLSFEEYKTILKKTGFRFVHSEERSQDMYQTYSLLAKQLEASVQKNGVTQQLYKRFNQITQAVSQKKMGWGIFIARR